MFRNNFVCSLKVGNKFLKEDGDIIHIPFGVEYSVFLKNLNSRKAVVKVSIDGKNVLDGSSLVVQPNSVLELEGFLDGNRAKNKFKFIKMTRQIEDFRGTTPEDGLLRVEFDYEKEPPLTKDIVYIPWQPYPYGHPWYPNYPYWTYNPIITWSSTASNASGQYTISGGGGHTSSIGPMATGNVNNSTYTVFNYCSDANTDTNGITVPGNDVDQTFYSTYVGEMENHPTVITLKMIGTTANIPVFTSDKKICQTCGISNRNKNKFCSSCGSHLTD